MFIENKKTRFAILLEYVIYGFFIIFPFFIFKNFLYQGSSTRFLTLSLATAILSIFFGIYLLNSKNKISFWKSPILLVFGIYLAYLFVSAFLGVDFSASFWSRAERTSGLFYLTHLAVFLLFLIHIVSEKSRRDLLIKIVLYTSAVYSFCSILGRQGFNLIFKNNPYDGFLFGNSSFAAMYLLGAFLLSVYFLFSKNKREINWYEYLLPFLIILNPFLLNTKGGYSSLSSIFGGAQASSIALFVSVGVLLVIFFISKIKDNKVKKVTAISVFVLAILSAALGMRSLVYKDGIVRNFYESKSTLARPLVWALSKNAIQEKPLTGWGGDNFTEAYQENFDINLLTEKYGNEPWFDRAHNIVIDSAVEGGYLGTIIYFSLYLVLLICLLYVLLNAKEKEDSILASVLITYFFVHLIELQTAFDTTISYPLLALMLSLSVYLFNKVQSDFGKNTEFKIGIVGKSIFGIILIGYFTWSLFFGVFPFIGNQKVNGEIRHVGSSEKRIPLYEKLFKSKVDPAGVLWRISTDFQRGISENPKILENPKTVESLIKEVEVITKGYEDYVAENPNHFRSHLNLADMYIYQNLFGVNRLADADKVLDRAIEISPRHPQPYWMKAVISLYRRDFNNARLYVEKAKAMNPDVVETKRLEEYIEESIKTFPEVDLYSFVQI